ncbi:uncharacterized protein At5g08430-like [Rutidosis leptorrhynchoides]|uniref:uncharacterized protein At5g08430-like n=1 Tax=Rutidosis leptorrhynchoides TaxID=125765 RepID=UPI003A9A0424
MGKGFEWVEEHNGMTLSPMKHKRKFKTKKMEFVGWGSKLLIEFLQSIGKDIGKQLSHIDVTTIINNYVNSLNLINPIRKKKVDCDERLFSLFGKKSIARNKIHELLESHFAENNDSSEDEQKYSSDEYEDFSKTGKKQKVSSSHSPKKKAYEAPGSCFAAIIPENIKLLYLRKSLVQELVKHPESFEGKLLGSYIRIKSDPNDFSQKNSHQLHPVTGVKNVPRNGVCGEVLLQVPNMMKDIPICTLSDVDFSKEECEDLCQRVKDGLLKRPTVVEVEQKAQMLHEDITKHWIPRELVYLQNLIDRANEKGWRKELFDYLERKKKLQTPSEVSKLLTEVPKVTADALEPEDTPQEQLQDTTEPVQDTKEPVISVQRDVFHLTLDSGKAVASHGPSPVELEPLVVLGVNEGRSEPMENTGLGKQLTGQQGVKSERVPKTTSPSKALDITKQPNVIELSDDEEEQKEYDLTHKMWFYLDPQGQKQGPVSKKELKLWSDLGYFTSDFKVWKDGQTSDRAILLKDMLSDL